MSSARPAGADPSTPIASLDEAGLVAALRNGDAAAFASLLERYYPAMLRLAQIYVPNRAVAEEVVQETWLAVLQGLARFAGRASLKTWIFRILTNRAKTRGMREGRSVPFSALSDLDASPAEPAVDPARFYPPGQRSAGHWISLPLAWEHLPEERLLAQETRACILQAVAALPPGQRAVISLRDIEGWSAAEVCTILGVSEANQRVLLHRARSKVRHALEHYFAGVSG